VLTLFARKGVATRLAILARLFYFGDEELMPAVDRRFAAAVRALGFARGMALVILPAVSLAVALGTGATPRAFAAADASRVVTDEVGREMKVPAEAKRIVSLAPNLTETIYALGLEDRLVGDTNFCDTPPAAKSKPHVGDPQNPNLESIVALHPDIVLATTSINRIDTADALKNAGIPVYTTDPQTVRGMLDSTSHMADAIGASQQGAELVARLQQRLDALSARLHDRPMAHVLFVVWLEPLQTIGQDTFIADALRWAGAESVLVSKQKWPRLSIEEVVRLQPDYIVFTDDHSGGASTSLADLRARPVWRDLDAVVQGHVVNVSEEIVRPSPGLVDVIEQLARQVHPEAFADGNEMRMVFAARAGLRPAPTNGGCVGGAACAR
jgi:iron complex transport system substrate-binding protein